MKSIVVIVLVSCFIVFGLLLSLIALYASPDEKVHFLEASYIWVGNAIGLLGLLCYLKKPRE